MTAKNVQDLIVAALRSAVDEGIADDHEVLVESVQTFEEAGVMTYDKGLVVRLQDGAEFQISLVQSRHGGNW